MNEDTPPPIDWEMLRRETAEAIRRVLREEAAKRGMSYDDFLDSLFSEERPERR